jgi:HEAT repeat protein
MSSFLKAVIAVLAVSVYLPAQDIRSTDPKQRVKAARELGKQASPSAVEQLTPLLSDPEANVRAEAVKAIVQVGTAGSLDPLIQALKDNDSTVQMLAADGIVNYYLPGYVQRGLKKIGSTLRTGLTGDDNDQIVPIYTRVREDVVIALGRVASGGSSMESRANAARAVGVLRGRAAIPDLIASLKAKNSDVIYESLAALQKIRDNSVGPRIVFLVNDLDDRVQTTALETVGLLECKECAPDVRKAFNRARNVKIKRSALAALAMIPVEENREVYLKYFNDKDDSLRASAAEGLGRLKNPADLPMIQKAFDEESKMNSRLAQAFAIVDLGKLDMAEFGAERYLVNTLNSAKYKNIAQAYLVELARSQAVRESLYPALTPSATKDEKIGLAHVFAASGDRASVDRLQPLSKDSDNEIASEVLRALRILKTRLE